MNAEDKTNFLLEEYRQCYENIRNNVRAADSKEAIFTVAAFGIIALIVSKNFSLGYTIGAMSVSLAFYFYQLVTSERISFYAGAYKKRLIEIESKINEKMSEDNIRVQTKLHDYETEASNGYNKWIRERSMRRMLAVLLVFLWGIVIGLKIGDTALTKSKVWHHHDQTRYHRPFR